MSRRGLTTFHFRQLLSLHVIPAFTDNYLYALQGSTAAQCAVVDPGDGNVIMAFLAQNQLQLSHILLTHHHRDHTGGVAQLLAAFPSATIICSTWMKIPDSWTSAQIIRMSTGEEVGYKLFGQTLRAIDVRGHTLDHIAFVLPASPGDEGPCEAFVGDSLFGAGCGGLFEGSYEQMLQALIQLRSLPANTRLWCAHEYTLKNLRVAVQLGEDNPEQADRLAKLEHSVAQAGAEPHEWMTIPLMLSQEIETNPFLRWDQPSLQKAIDTRSSLETFTHVRQFRDRF
ncbi:MAG: hydroxyacylglutathione hydrolase [Pseudomonadota bacterium]|jgi:hydroxyacylglutathione hydrolase